MHLKENNYHVNSTPFTKQKRSLKDKLYVRKKKYFSL